MAYFVGIAPLLLLLAGGTTSAQPQQTVPIEKGKSAGAEAPPKPISPEAPLPLAPDPVRELRRHWGSFRSDGTLLYEVTTIKTTSQRLSSTVALVRDSKQQSWQFDDVYDFERQTVGYQITQLATGEFVRLSYEIPLQSRSRLEAIAEAHAQKGDETSVRNQDPQVTIATRLTSRTAAESEWKDLEKTTDLRSDLRTSLSTAFVDALERMRGTLIAHDRNLASFKAFMRLLSYSPECEVTEQYSRMVEMWPDCAFDKDLGRACSREQLDRIDRAEKKGTLPARY